MNDLVSVIIPVYNGAQFIGAAIESAQTQTHRELDIIVVDDGSTDATLQIVNEYAANDDRIRVIPQKNGGVAEARNTAIEAALGEFIAPLDADDLWLPDKIERQLQAMSEAGPDCGFVYCWWASIDPAGRVLDRSPRWTIAGHQFEMLFVINVTGNASVPLFRRRCLLEAGGYNSKLAAAKSGGCEDLEVALRIAARYSIAVVPDILVGYRRVPGSMSSACDTMWRSRQLVLQNILPLRSDITPSLLRRSDQQFSIYLAALSFWSGNIRQAMRWGLSSGIRLPYLFAPHILKALLKPRGAHQNYQIMRPGKAIDTDAIPEPLLPYDRIFSKH
jgi:glycosyltransferase involved in cell wall biosynthesis